MTTEESEAVIRRPALLGEVARRLGYSPIWVRRLDDVLRPLRTSTGSRVYCMDIVERVAAEREASRSRK